MGPCGDCYACCLMTLCGFGSLNMLSNVTGFEKYKKIYTEGVITHVSHSDIRTFAASGHEMLQWRLLT